MNKVENRQTFLNRLEGHFSQADIDLIEFAYDLSKEAHRTQKRDRGGRYFEHPRAGCIIMLDELKLYDKDLLVAFLFHDVGEDTPLLGNRVDSYKEFVRKAHYRLSLLFGARVADIVIRLTKPEIDQVQFFTKDETSRFYLAGLQESDGAIIDKAVDRLHNLRTILGSGYKESKVLKTVEETEKEYLPLFSSVQGPLRPHADLLIRLINTELQTIKASL